MKLLSFIFTLFLLAPHPPLHAQDEDLVHKTEAERQRLLYPRYWDILPVVDSVQLVKKLDHIQELARQNDDEELLLEARLVWATWSRYRVTRAAIEVTGPLDSLYREGEKRHKPWLQIRAAMVLADYNFLVSHQYETGFELLEKTYQLMKHLSAEEFPLKKLMLFGISNQHYVFADYRDAIFYAQEGLKLNSTIPDPYGSVIITNTMGLCYRELNLLDSSDFCFQSSYQKAVALGSRAWQGICSGNLGYNNFLRKEYDRAIPLLQKDIAIATETQDWGLASGSLMPMAAISLERNQLAEARQQLELAQDYVDRSGQYKRKRMLYPLLSKLYAAEGKPRLAALFLDSALEVRDSLNRQFNTLQIVRAQQKTELERHKAEVTGIAGQKQVEVLKRNILIALVILIMALAIYAFRRQQLRQKQNRQQLLQAENELKLATKQLNDFTRYISEKNALIENLQKKLGDNELEAIEQLQRSTILTDEEWEYFRQIFEKVHSGYLQRLKEKMPGLTPAETRFMVLSKLKFSNKEMAATLGVTTQAIRVTWHRLRKKLDLPEESSISELVDSL